MINNSNYKVGDWVKLMTVNMKSGEFGHRVVQIKLVLKPLTNFTGRSIGLFRSSDGEIFSENRIISRHSGHPLFVFIDDSLTNGNHPKTNENIL